MPEPVHRDHARKFLVGVATLAVLGLVAWIGVSVQGGGEVPMKSYTYVTAAFDDVGTLRDLQGVSQNGVRIGQVNSIEYTDGRAIVTMRLDGQRDVYRDARARIVNESVLGPKKVQLDPGKPNAGKLGDRAIPTSQTSDSVSLDDALSVFDERTRTALSSSLVELGGGLAGHSNDLRDAVRAAPGLLDDTGVVTAALASEEAGLPSLLAAANRLTGRFEGRQHELRDLLEQMDTTLRAVNVDGARPLDHALQVAPATLRQARRGLKSLNEPLADVRSAAATIRPGGQALGASADRLRGFLREAVVPLGKMPAVGDKAGPAVEDLTRTVSDARPLVPRVSRTVANASVLLHDLAPYATDVGRFVSQHDLLDGRFAPDKHYFSVLLAMPGPFSASAPDPLTETVPYPEPGGEAWRDHANYSGGGR